MLAPGEFTLEYAAREGWSVSQDDGFTVAVDTNLDEELEREGRVLDLIHTVQRLRKDSGLEVTDRIALTLPRSAEDLVHHHEDWIRAETLAVSVELGEEIAVEKA